MWSSVVYKHSIYTHVDYTSVQGLSSLRKKAEVAIWQGVRAKGGSPLKFDTVWIVFPS